MSQYCFARRIAESWSYELTMVPTTLFPRATPISGERILSPILVWEGHWPRDAQSGRRIDIEELALPVGAKLVVRGSFQRFEYIADIRDVVRSEWLKPGIPLQMRPSSDFVICLYLTDHLKGVGATDNNSGGSPSSDDIALKDSALLEQEIRYLAKVVSYKRLYFVTDRPDHSLFRNLSDLKAIVHAQGSVRDFLFIQSFQKVAFSQNILYWWAAFLGCAREVYPPPFDRGLWSHAIPAKFAYDPEYYGIDLRVCGENHWIYNWHDKLS